MPESIVALLRDAGADRIRHAGSRSPLDHLIGTRDLVRRWQQPEWLQNAALLHSVYGTDRFHEQLLPLDRRGEVAVLAGERAERLGYLFGITPRESLFAGTVPGDGTREELDELVLLQMANLADQAQSDDGSPGRWLVRLRELAETLTDSDTVAPPPFVAELAWLSDDDELATRRAYADGIERADDLAGRASQFALAVASCPVVAEPCVWLAHIALCRADLVAARWWAARAAAI